MTSLPEILSAAEAATVPTLPAARASIFAALYGLGALDSDALPVLKALAKATDNRASTLEHEYREYKRNRDKTDTTTDATDEVPADVRREAERILIQPDIIAAAVEVMQQRGVVGEERSLGLLYAASTSRITDKPISVLVKGRSSGGKSYIVQAALDMMPSSAALTLTAMSSKALVYTDIDLRHKHIVIYEEDGNDESEYIVRSLLSEGRVSYLTADKQGGEIKGRHIIKDGPTGLITTGTRAMIREDNETRAWSLYIDDSKEQTRRVLEAAAGGAATATPRIDTRPWQVAQELLEPGPVLIKYAPRIYLGIDFERVANDVTRLRRDFPRFLQLVTVVALLHQRQRDRTPDGAIVATRADYEIAYRLSSETFTHSAMNLSKRALTVAEAVRAHFVSAGRAVTVRELAKELRWARPTVQKWIKQAEEADLVSTAQEGAGQRAATFEPGERFAAAPTVLPTPEAVFAATFAATGGTSNNVAAIAASGGIATSVAATTPSGTKQPQGRSVAATQNGEERHGGYAEQGKGDEETRQGQQYKLSTPAAQQVSSLTTTTPPGNPPHPVVATNGSYDVDALERDIERDAPHLDEPGIKEDGTHLSTMLGLFRRHLQEGTLREVAPRILDANGHLAEYYGGRA